MKVTIIGWYGTETIGDRAILAGLISIINKAHEYFEIKLGSLYPFFSERTIDEDSVFYKEIANKNIQIEIFNSKNSRELSRAIKDSDLVAMGGGPLMDLNELFMIEYAFKKAKKLGVKTALLGCGVGPLFHRKFRKSVLNIVLNSDIVILRDSKSKDNLNVIYSEFGIVFDEKIVGISYDPSVECISVFNEISSWIKQDYIAVNLRKFPLEYSKCKDAKNIDKDLKQFVNILADQYRDREIRLIPMHYFHIGDDDRVILNEIALDIQKENVTVQNQNLTLRETIEVYGNAYFNIGMRFHSIVMQTIASGKNYIFDYTEPKRGKIFGFIQDIDKSGFYNSRYLSLQVDDISAEIIQNEKEKFSFDKNQVQSRLNVYLEKLQRI